MHIRVFDTENGNDYIDLQALVARDGRDISVDKIYTAACGSRNGHYHYVTVIYFTLEQTPAQE